MNDSLNCLVISAKRICNNKIYNRNNLRITQKRKLFIKRRILNKTQYITDSQHKTNRETFNISKSQVENYGNESCVTAKGGRRQTIHSRKQVSSSLGFKPYEDINDIHIRAINCLRPKPENKHICSILSNPHQSLFLRNKPKNNFDQSFNMTNYEKNLYNLKLILNESRPKSSLIINHRRKDLIQKSLTEFINEKIKRVEDLSLERCQHSEKMIEFENLLRQTANIWKEKPILSKPEEKIDNIILTKENKDNTLKLKEEKNAKKTHCEKMIQTDNTIYSTEISVHAKNKYKSRLKRAKRYHL